MAIDEHWLKFERIFQYQQLLFKNWWRKQTNTRSINFKNKSTHCNDERCVNEMDFIYAWESHKTVLLTVLLDDTVYFPHILFVFIMRARDTSEMIVSNPKQKQRRHTKKRTRTR